MHCVFTSGRDGSHLIMGPESPTTNSESVKKFCTHKLKAEKVANYITPISKIKNKSFNSKNARPVTVVILL